MKRSRNKKRCGRSIDASIKEAIDWVGSVQRLFEVAAKSAFDKLRKTVEEIEATVKEALARYLDHKSVPKWLRRFVFTGTYRKVPQLA